MFSTEFGAKYLVAAEVNAAVYKKIFDLEILYHSESNMTAARAVVIDYDFIRGRQDKTVVKVLYVASAAASD